MSDTDRKDAESGTDPVDVEVKDGDAAVPADEAAAAEGAESSEALDGDEPVEDPSAEDDDEAPHEHAVAEEGEDPADRSEEEDAALDAELEELREVVQRADESSDDVVEARVVEDDDGTPPPELTPGEVDAMDFLESQLEAARAELSAMATELAAAQELANQKDAGRARLQADFDNFRKRQEREVQRLKDEGVEKLLLKVLPVYDTFGRAIDQYEKDDSEDALYTGLQMIEKMFQQLLEAQGITPIEAAGKPFDPNLHDAVCRVEIPEDGFDDMVVDVFETGYIFNEKVLKPAKVSVAKD